MRTGRSHVAALISGVLLFAGRWVIAALDVGVSRTLGIAYYVILFVAPALAAALAQAGAGVSVNERRSVLRPYQFGAVAGLIVLATLLLVSGPDGLLARESAASTALASVVSLLLVAASVVVPVLLPAAALIRSVMQSDSP